MYATAAYAAILLIMSLYAARLVFLRIGKPKPTVALCAVLSVTLPAVIALSLFDILPFESITHLTFIVTGLLLFITVTVSDRSYILNFAKINCVSVISDGIIILDYRGRFLFANMTARRLFTEFAGNNTAKINEFLKTLPEHGELERFDRIFSVKTDTYMDHIEKLDCKVIHIRDIAEQQLREDRLEKEAAVDSITGVSSRTVTVETLKELCETEKGTLLVISLDGFRAMKNAYGAEESNELLKTFGTLLKNNTYAEDIRGRFGGGKFVVFLRDCTSESVVSGLTMRLEEQMTTAVKKQLGEDVPISVGVSVGAVHVPACGREFEKLAAVAETEQRKIKHTGGHGYSLIKQAK